MNLKSQLEAGCDDSISIPIKQVLLKELKAKYYPNMKLV